MIAWIKKLGCPNFSKTNGVPVTRKSIRCIVIHYTAGTLDSTLSWFSNTKSKVSAHLVIDRDGTVYELLEPEKIAWHAGVSSWRGMSRVNSFSYGIELVSTEKDNFKFTDEQYAALRVALWGGLVLADLNRIRYDEHAEVFHGGVAKQFGLSDRDIGQPDAEILGHEHVAPGRKTDPGPNFDWHQITQEKALQPQVTHQVEASESPEESQQATENKLISLLSIVWQVVKKLIRVVSGRSS